MTRRCKHGYSNVRNCPTCSGEAGARRVAQLQSRRSVYDRADSAGPGTVVMTQFGKFLGVERDGEFEPAKPCCPDALKCERPECWTRIGGSFDG